MVLTSCMCVPPPSHFIYFSHTSHGSFSSELRADPEMSRGPQEKYPNLLSSGQPGWLRPAGHTEAPALTLSRSPDPFHPICVSGISSAPSVCLLWSSHGKQTPGFQELKAGERGGPGDNPTGMRVHSLSTSDSSCEFNIASKLCTICLRGDLLTAIKWHIQK